MQQQCGETSLSPKAGSRVTEGRILLGKVSELGPQVEDESELSRGEGLWSRVAHTVTV